MRVPTKEQETYRTPNIQDHKKFPITNNKQNIKCIE